MIEKLLGDGLDLLYDLNDGAFLYDANDPPSLPVAPIAPETILLYDINDGALLYDVNDGAFLYDLSDGLGGGGTAEPPVSGGIDAVGGPIGGPIGERVYLVDSPALGASSGGSGGPIDVEWLTPGNHPIAGEMFPLPTGGGPVLAPFDFKLANVDFISRHDDPDEPSKFWDGRVIDPGSVNLTLPLVPVGDAAIGTNFGTIVVDNTDGALDTLLDTNLAISQPIEVKLGTRRSFVNAFVTVANARITGIGMTQDEVTIEVRDPGTYAQNLYPTTVYTGTGGFDGPEELEGTVKPVVLGRVWNMAPVLIDAVRLIYQAHDGPVAAITGVFDGGVPLTFSADHANYTALAAATVSPGTYATCRAGGLIRVGSTPVFAVTAHLDGHAPAGVTCRSIATWLVGQVEAVLGLDVDLDAFGALPNHVAGWAWNDEFTFREALNRFVGDAGYHWGADVTGPITVLRLDPPDSGGVYQSFDVADIMDLEREALPDGFGGVHHRRIIRYGRNWTVQEQLAATAVHKPLRQREWKRITGTRTTGSRNAIDPPVLDTSLATSAGASALAERLLDLHGTYRRMFGLETRIFGKLPKLGSTVRVTHPRFGLAGGDLFRVVDIGLSLGDGDARLLLWG